VKWSTNDDLTSTQLVNYSLYNDNIVNMPFSEEDKQAARLEECDQMDQQLIDSAIKQWHKCLTACFRTRWTPGTHYLRQNSKLIKS